MSSRNPIDDIAVKATVQAREDYKSAWGMFLHSVDTGRPYFVLQRQMGHEIGNAALENIATRFRYG